MNYPFELRQQEAHAVRERRRIARHTARCKVEENVNDHKSVSFGQLPSDSVGIAFSGGGIRSATFCLGVLQGLARKNRLRDIDFLSSVSGGGYIGCFLGRLFTRQPSPKEVLTHVCQSCRGNPCDCDPCENVQQILRDNRSYPIQWLRAHGNYIFSTGSDEIEGLGGLWRNLAAIHLVLAFLGVAIFGILHLLGEYCSGFQVFEAPLVFGIALSVWWPLPALFFAFAVIPNSLAYWLVPRCGNTARLNFVPLGIWVLLFSTLGLLLAAADAPAHGLLAVAILASTPIWLELAGYRSSSKTHRTRQSQPSSSISGGSLSRDRLTLGLGEVLGLFAASLLWVFIDTLAKNLASGHLIYLLGGWSAVATALFPLLQKFAQKWMQPAKASDSKPLLSTGTKAALIAFPLVILLLTLQDAFVHWLFLQKESWGFEAMALASASSILLGTSIQFLNTSSLLHAYTERLSRCFLGASNPKRSRDSDNANRNVLISDPEDDLPFHEYHPERHGGPLHLINLCINETVDAVSQREARDRKGLSMCVGPCGVTVGRRFHSLWSLPPAKTDMTSRLIHWVQHRGNENDSEVALKPIVRSSESFHVLMGKTEGPVLVEPLPLSSWMGISAAAFGTGTGTSTRLSFSLLCGLANVRLGYWWNSGISGGDRPGRYPRSLWHRIKQLPMYLTRMQMMLVDEFRGSFAGPGQRYWNLSDGGHFEITGLYELIRRRVPFILAVDAGHDISLTFSDLGDLVRLVRIDFSAEMTFLDLEHVTMLKRYIEGGKDYIDAIVQRPFSAQPILEGEPQRDSKVLEDLEKELERHELELFQAGFLGSKVLDSSLDRNLKAHALEKELAQKFWWAKWLQLEAIGSLEKIGKNGGHHAALARVAFPTDCKESVKMLWIILLKSSLTGDESLDVMAFKQADPDFPNDSTANQFFTEEQWESYRCLGEHISQNVFRTNQAS